MSVGNKSQESLNSEEVINNYVKNAATYTGKVNKATGKGGREMASEGKQVLETILESKEYIKVQKKRNIQGILMKTVLILGLITLTVFVVTSICLEPNKEGEGNCIHKNSLSESIILSGQTQSSKKDNLNSKSQF